MRRARIAGLLALPLVLVGVSACRDDRGATPPLTNAPGASVQKQFDDIESTLDNIESELNDG